MSLTPFLALKVILLKETSYIRRNCNPKRADKSRAQHLCAHLYSLLTDCYLWSSPFLTSIIISLPVTSLLPSSRTPASTRYFQPDTSQPPGTHHIQSGTHPLSSKACLSPCLHYCKWYNQLLFFLNLYSECHSWLLLHSYPLH